MKAMSRNRRVAKWGLTLATVFLLGGAALAPWAETQVTKAVSVQMADGLLTIRTWGTAGGVTQGIPTDDPARHPRGIPDTWNIPLWVFFVVFAVPAAVLWWADRLPGAGRFRSESARTSPGAL